MPQTPQDWITTILGTVIVICRFIDEGADPFTQPSKLIELIALELLAYFTNHPEVTAAPTGEGEL